MNPIFSRLPESLVNKILEYRAEQVMINVTTGEYIENFTTFQLRSLLRKNTKKTAEITGDIGESHWKRTDKIVISPLHIEPYVRFYYTKIYLD